MATTPSEAPSLTWPPPGRLGHLFGFGGTAQGDLLARAGRFLCYLNALSFRIRYDMPLCVVLDKCLASRAWTIPVCGAKSVST